jgi:hypothetical protein
MTHTAFILVSDAKWLPVVVASSFARRFLHQDSRNHAELDEPVRRLVGLFGAFNGPGVAEGIDTKEATEKATGCRHNRLQCVKPKDGLGWCGWDEAGS